MSIRKYTNFEEVSLKTSNEGQFLQAEDFFIVTKNETDEAVFGDCKYDVMEVAIYDINNNLLPQKTGNTVAYIKSQNIAEYMYNVTNAGGQKELAINAEKLLNDLGFTNGILKLNINFVRNAVGSENELERVWIQEISPSREEIRILPLKTKFENINQKNNRQFDGMNKLTKDFNYYKKAILNNLDFYEINYLEKIDSTLQSRFGSEFFSVLKTDFGLSKFSDLRTKIFSDFKTSVFYYLENKYYTLGDGNYGQPSEIRFDGCEKYDFALILGDIQNILANCININMSFLKRRDIRVSPAQKEFQKTELVKEVKDNVDSFINPVKNVSIVFDKEKLQPVELPPAPIDSVEPEMPIKPPPVIENPIDLGPPVEIVLPVEPPVKPKEPILIIENPKIEEPIEPIKPPVEPKEVITEPIDIKPSYGSGGGGGGPINSIFENDLGTGLGRERLLTRDMETVQNLS